VVSGVAPTVPMNVMAAEPEFSVSAFAPVTEPSVIAPPGDMPPVWAFRVLMSTEPPRVAGIAERLTALLFVKMLFESVIPVPEVIASPAIGVVPPTAPPRVIVLLVESRVRLKLPSIVPEKLIAPVVFAVVLPIS